MTPDQPKLTVEQAIEIAQVIRQGGAMVCYAKCWPCQFGQCSDEPHTWMDDEDREHAGIPASVSAAELAVQKPCGCRCMNKHREQASTDTTRRSTEADHV